MESSLDEFDAIYLRGSFDPALSMELTGRAELEALSAEERADARAKVRQKVTPEAFDACSPEDQEKIVYIEMCTVRIGRYYRERDLELLRFEGHPALFRIQRPGPIWLSDAPSIAPMLAQRRTLAFRAFVHRIHRDGKTILEAVRPERKGEHTLVQSGDAWLAPESYLKAVQKMFSAEVIQELGQVALDFAELSEAKKAPFGLWGGSVARPSVLG